MSSPYPVQKIDPAGSTAVYSSKQPPMFVVTGQSSQNKGRYPRPVIYTKFYHALGIVFVTLSIAMFVVELTNSLKMEPFRIEESEEDNEKNINVQVTTTTDAPKWRDPFIAWTGVWVALFTFIAGILMWIAGDKCSRCCLMSAYCMDWCNIVVLFIGLGLAIGELIHHEETEGKNGVTLPQAFVEALDTNIIKAIIVIVLISVLGCLTLAHLIVSSYEMCCRRLDQVGIDPY